VYEYHTAPLETPLLGYFIIRVYDALADIIC